MSGGNPDGPEQRRRRPTVQTESQTTQKEFSSSGNLEISSHRSPGTVPVEQRQQAAPPGSNGGSSEGLVLHLYAEFCDVCC